MGKQSSARNEGVPIEKYRKTIGKQQEMWASNKSISQHYRRKQNSLSSGDSGTGSGSSGNKSKKSNQLAEKSKKSNQLAENSFSFIWKRVAAVLILISVMILVYHYFQFMNSKLPN